MPNKSKAPKQIKVNCERCGRMAIEEGIRRDYVLKAKGMQPYWQYRHVELCKQCIDDLGRWLAYGKLKPIK